MGGQIVKGCVATIKTLAFTWDELGCHWRLFLGGGMPLEAFKQRNDLL